MYPISAQRRESEKVPVLWHLCYPETCRVLRFAKNITIQNFFALIMIIPAAKFEF